MIYVQYYQLSTLHVGMDPIPFYKANMESLLSDMASPVSETTPQALIPGAQMPFATQMGRLPASTSVPIKLEPQAPPPHMPTMNPVRAFSLPSQEGVGVIGQNQSTQSADYIHLIKNALNVPGLSAVAVQPQQLKLYVPHLPLNEVHGCHLLDLEVHSIIHSSDNIS